MKILITGVTGMVGSHLLDKLIEDIDNYEKIICCCRWRSSNDNVSHLYKSEAVRSGKIVFEHMDLRDPISVSNLMQKYKDLNHIYHLAAQSYPHVSFHSPIETLDTNIIGTYNLLNFILKYSPSSKVHICSSSEVFGRVPSKFVPINEEVPFHPASPYAISKVGTDLIGKYFNEGYGLKTFNTRMFTHTGPRRGDVFHESTFAKQIALIEHGFTKDKTIRVGNLDSLRTYADVRDAVKAYISLMLSDRTGSGEAFNIGGDYTCKVGDTLNFLINQSSLKNEIKVVVDQERLRPIDADLQVPDTTKFKKYIKWNQEYTFEQTMRDLLDFWRKKVKETNNTSFLIR